MNSIRIANGKTMQKLIVRDDTDVCQITWFNQPYLKDRFQLGENYTFFGGIQKKYNKINLISPVYDAEETAKNTKKIIPIYPLTYHLSQNTLRQIIENGLKEAGELEETLPEYLLNQYHLIDRNTAIQQIHFPDSFQSFQQARNRLAFEELFSMQLALLRLKNQYENTEKGIQFLKEIKMSDVICQLPFSLTKAQLKVIEEIDYDMEQTKAMNRLLQGDVGSRKNNC